ncbi:MAG: acetyl-CoA carboxylase biotin carboxyl carrier protein [Firmicutes bacterium]|nr:acetyl-CoA carboxylase biotin carboxyl carrier protein [Bacillota bacterium]
MDIKKIKELAKLLDEEQLTAIEVSDGDSTIRLEKNPINNTVIGGGFSGNPNFDAAFNMPPVATAATVKEEPVDFNNAIEFKAPIIGVYYSAPSPDAKPFIEVGQKIKKGDVVCIIEAMKVLNEITADKDGTVIDICIQNGAVVEYGQVLFKMQ